MPSVGIWPVAGLDAAGNPRPGPVIGVRWRSLTAEEYRRLTARYSGPQLWCEVYTEVMLLGPPLDEAPAGIVAWIAQSVLEECPFSGEFRAISTMLSKARERVQGSYLLCARAVVASVFRYTFEEIDSWTSEVFFERVAQAELLTNVPLNPSDPNRPEPTPQTPPQKKQAPRPVRRLAGRSRQQPETVVTEQGSFSRGKPSHIDKFDS